MKIVFLIPIANRKRGQTADVDTETAEALVSTGVARAATAIDDTSTDESTVDADQPDAANKPRRR